MIAVQQPTSQTTMAENEEYIYERDDITIPSIVIRLGMAKLCRHKGDTRSERPSPGIKPEAV
jgi:hypothetical protein